MLDQLQGLRDQLVDTTANARRRQNLTQSLDNHLIVSRGDVARHVMRQSLAWQQATAQDRLDLLQKQAVLDYGAPDSVANYAEASRSAALHPVRIAGAPADSDAADEAGSTAASTIWRSAIEATLAKDDTRPAIALHDRAAEDLSPADAAILDRYIQGARERQTGQDYVGGLALPESDPSRPLDVTEDIAALDAAHAAVTAQNDTDWPDDDSQRATNQHFIDVMFGRKKRDVVQAKADLDHAVDDWLNRPGQVERPSLDLWTRLNPDVQRDVDAVLRENADLARTILPKIESSSSTPTKGGVIPVMHPGNALAECHNECLEEYEKGLFGHGPAAFFPIGDAFGNV